MEAQIKQRWAAVENRRKALVQRVRDLPPQKQNAKPNADSFTPTELIMHMALSDQATLERIHKRPPSALTNIAPKPSIVFKKIVGDMQAGKKLPAPGNMQPQGPVSLDDAEKKREAVRRELGNFFEMAYTPETVLQKSFLLGRLSAANLLTLLEAHHHYHERYFPA